jgi:hypothetical protein
VVESKPTEINWQVPVMLGGFAFLAAAAWILGEDNRKKKKEKPAPAEAPEADAE